MFHELSKQASARKTLQQHDPASNISCATLPSGSHGCANLLRMSAWSSGSGPGRPRCSTLGHTRRYQHFCKPRPPRKRPPHNRRHTGEHDRCLKETRKVNATGCQVAGERGVAQRGSCITLRVTCVQGGNLEQASLFARALSNRQTLTRMHACGTTVEWQKFNRPAASSWTRQQQKCSLWGWQDRRMSVLPGARPCRLPHNDRVLSGVHIRVTGLLYQHENLDV